MGRLSLSDKGKKLLSRVVIAVFISICLAGAGCDGDKEEESHEAQLEDALMALDDFDYSRAVQILEDMDPTVDVLKYLSSAYAGLVGLDTFNILKTADNGSGNASGIGFVGSLLGGDGELTAVEIAESLANINKSIEKLETIATIQGVAVSELETDLKVQLGLMSITRTTLTLGDVVEKNDLMEPVILTEEALGELSPVMLPVVDQVQSDAFAEDLIYIALATDALSDGNILKDDFTEFSSDLNNDGGPTVTGTEIQQYINTL